MPILLKDEGLFLGYPGDGGLGERLLAQVERGEKRSTCLPASEMSPAELDAALALVGQAVRIVTGSGPSECRVTIRAAYVASLLDPPAELLEGEGYNAAVGRFQDDHFAPPIVSIDDVAAARPIAARIGALDVEFRLPVLLHDVMLWTIPEIVLATALPPETVRQSVRRGRMMLRHAHDHGHAAVEGTCWDARWSMLNSGHPHSDHLESCSACSVVASSYAAQDGRDGDPPADSLVAEVRVSETLGRPFNQDLAILVVLFDLLPSGGSGSA